MPRRIYSFQGHPESISQFRDTMTSQLDRHPDFTRSADTKRHFDSLPEMEDLASILQRMGVPHAGASSINYEEQTPDSDEVPHLMEWYFGEVHGSSSAVTIVNGTIVHQESFSGIQRDATLRLNESSDNPSGLVMEIEYNHASGPLTFGASQPPIERLDRVLSPMYDALTAWSIEYTVVEQP